jgi:hypothetical protein
LIVSCAKAGRHSPRMEHRERNNRRFIRRI